MTGTVNLTAESPYGNGNVASSTWSTPSGLPILFVEAYYAETSSTTSITGYIYSGGANLKTFQSNASKHWFDVEPGTYKSLQAKVNDSYYGQSGKLTIYQAMYSAKSTIATEMTVMQSSGKFDAKGNYWGVTVPTSTQVVEYKTGTVDFTSFKTTPISNTGPQ